MNKTLNDLIANAKCRWAQNRDKGWLLKNVRNLNNSDAPYLIKTKKIAVVKLNGRNVGFLRLEWPGLWFPHIGQIVIEKKLRNKGLGSLLLDFVEQELFRGGKRVLYSSSTQGETRPLKWHRRKGFQLCGRIKNANGAGIDELFWIKKLRFSRK